MDQHVCGGVHQQVNESQDRSSAQREVWSNKLELVIGQHDNTCCLGYEGLLNQCDACQQASTSVNSGQLWSTLVNAGVFLFHVSPLHVWVNRINKGQHKVNKSEVGEAEWTIVNVGQPKSTRINVSLNVSTYSTQVNASQRKSTKVNRSHYESTGDSFFPCAPRCHLCLSLLALVKSVVTY